MKKGNIDESAVSAKINLKPTAGYLLIEPVGAQTQTASGIYLPDTSTEKPQKGKVVSVGADEQTDKGTRPSPAKKGEVVIYKKWGGTEVKISGREYLFVKFEDIL